MAVLYVFGLLFYNTFTHPPTVAGYDVRSRLSTIPISLLTTNKLPSSLAAASVYNPSYVPTNWHTFLLTVLLLLIHGAISSMPTRHIAFFNSVSTWINMGFLLIVLIIIPSATTNREPRFNPSSEVWGTISVHIFARDLDFHG